MGSRRVEGSIICERPPIGSVTIEVVDTGAGMSESQMNSIFNEGTQFDANKLQAGGGSGLGLAIAKGIIDRHNGAIWAESEGLGKGSKFVVILPLQNSIDVVSDFGGRLVAGSCTARTLHLPESDQSSNQSADTPLEEVGQIGDKISSLPADYEPTRTIADEDHHQLQRTSPQDCECVTQGDNSTPIQGPAAQIPDQPTAAVVNDERPSRHRILVVEDVLASRKMLVRLLQRVGHECLIACNGKEAVDKIKATFDDDLEAGTGGKVDTILMDFEMPVSSVYGTSSMLLYCLLTNWLSLCYCRF
jgi:hypothetical protein